jgi:hypothetical protein
MIYFVVPITVVFVLLIVVYLAALGCYDNALTVERYFVSLVSTILSISALPILFNLTSKLSNLIRFVFPASSLENIVAITTALINQVALNQKSIRRIVLLKLFFPDDIVAEMTAMREKLFLEKKSIWYVRAKLFYEFIRLLWALNVQIKIDNLYLPSKQRNVDD